MKIDSIVDWILVEMDSLNKENAELIEWNPNTHPSPTSISNSCRLEKSNRCRAKIEAYLKLLDYIKGT